MARIVVPLNEAIHVLSANVDLGDAIKKIDATEAGPRLAFNVLGRYIYVTIRFQKFENSIAWFMLDGIPPFVNVNLLLKLPEGISVSGSQLKVNTDILIRNTLGLKGLAVQNVAWEGGSYRIDTTVY